MLEAQHYWKLGSHGRQGCEKMVRASCQWIKPTWKGSEPTMNEDDVATANWFINKVVRRQWWNFTWHGRAKVPPSELDPIPLKPVTSLQTPLVWKDLIFG